jgi:hypothetical protein
MSEAPYPSTSCEVKIETNDPVAQNDCRCGPKPPFVSPPDAGAPGMAAPRKEPPRSAGKEDILSPGTYYTTLSTRSSDTIRFNQPGQVTLTNGEKKNVLAGAVLPAAGVVAFLGAGYGVLFKDRGDSSPESLTPPSALTAIVGETEITARATQAGAENALPVFSNGKTPLVAVQDTANGIGNVALADTSNRIHYYPDEHIVQVAERGGRITGAVVQYAGVENYNGSAFQFRNMDDAGNVVSKVDLAGGVYSGSPLIAVSPPDGDVGETATLTVDMRGQLRAEKLAQAPITGTRQIAFEYPPGLSGPQTISFSPVVVTRVKRLFAGKWDIGISVVENTASPQK